MSLSKSLAILALASFLFIVSTVIAQDKLAKIDKIVKVETALPSEESLLSGLSKPTKGLAGFPFDFKKGEAERFQIGQDDEREPASLAKSSAAKKADWAASTSDGFEYKVRMKQQVTAVWVLKRDDHFDLIFANNNGSRVNMTIPAEQFYALKNAASDLRSPASDTSSCKDSFMQLEMVEKNTRKMVTTCLSTKSKQADELRMFGSTLTAIVR
jgi:hypothetical protein